MLDEGAGSRSALEIADAVDFLGADLGADERQRLRPPSGCTCRSRGSPTRCRSWPTSRCGRRSRTTSSSACAQQRLTSAAPGARRSARRSAQLAFSRVLYGTDAPLRHGADRHRRRRFKTFTADDLRAFYTSAFRPDNAALLVVGDVTADTVMPLLENAVRRLEGRRAPAPQHATLPTPPEPAGARRSTSSTSRARAQSQIRIGWIGVPRSTPDYFPIQVMNTILGGSFTSRLNLNLREKHGYTYGAGVAASTCGAPAGPFVAARRRADRQDGRGAEGVLQRAERHPAAGAGRRARAREELRLAALPARLRDDGRHLAPARGSARLPPARRLLLEVRARTSRRSPPPTCSASRRSTSSPAASPSSSSAIARRSSRASAR